MTAEPDLDRPGKPLIAKVQHEDGTWSPLEIGQTKRDNCAAAAAEAGGLDNVTDAHLAKWDLTRSDYNEFRMDHAKALQPAGRAAGADSGPAIPSDGPAAAA